MFGYDYFNVGPHYDLNSSLDTISTCIQGVQDDYNSRTITYHQAAEKLRKTNCGGNSDNEIYDILITENPNAPLHPLTDDEGVDGGDAPETVEDYCFHNHNRKGASIFSSGKCGACLDGYSENVHGNCEEDEEDEEVETQGETYIYPRNTERNLLFATVGILGLLVLWKK